jgi:hypothetical protein
MAAGNRPTSTRGETVPEPLDTIRRVNSDEPMSVTELRRAASILDRHTKSGKTDVLQARLRVTAKLEELGAGGSTSTGPSISFTEITRLNKRLKNGLELSREELLEARGRIDAAAGEVEDRGNFDYMLARIDARLHALDTGQPVVEPPKPAVDKKETIKGLAVIIGAVALVGGCSALVFGGNDGDSSGGGGSDGRDEIGAGIMCEQFIEDRLKSPSSADFQNSTQYVTTGIGDEYTVRGYVDAENSFGASLRSDWTCALRDNGDETWNLVSLTGLD